MVTHYCNLGQNICRIFHFLAQFLFTTSETKLDYYHQKVNVQVAYQVAEQLKAENPRKLGNFEMLGFNGECPDDHWRGKFWHLC